MKNTYQLLAFSCWLLATSYLRFKIQHLKLKILNVLSIERIPCIFLLCSLLLNATTINAQTVISSLKTDSINVKKVAVTALSTGTSGDRVVSIDGNGVLKSITQQSIIDNLQAQRIRTISNTTGYLELIKIQGPAISGFGFVNLDLIVSSWFASGAQADFYHYNIDIPMYGWPASANFSPKISIINNNGTKPDLYSYYDPANRTIILYLDIRRWTSNYYYAIGTTKSLGSASGSTPSLDVLTSIPNEAILIEY